MKALSITGLVLGVIGPLVLVLPILLGLLDNLSTANMSIAVFLLLTIPIGVALEVAAAVLLIIAGSLALKRRFRPRSVPILGITFVGSGLLIQLIGTAGFVSIGSGWEYLFLLVGMIVSLTGVIMCAVVGLRPVLALRR